MVTSSGQDTADGLRALLPGHNPWPLPDPRRLTYGGRVWHSDEVIENLEPHLSNERRRRIEDVVACRTDGIAVVVEGLVNLGNVSAVMRTTEGLGFLSVHIVVGEAKMKVSPRTSQGAEKWLDVYRWLTPSECVHHLHERGYRVLATHLEAGETLASCDFASERCALVFGNEAEGISEEMLRLCDARVVIPMPGFTRSFNISVAAAVALYHAHRDRSEGLGGDGDLSFEERRLLTADYFARSLPAAAKILSRDV